MSFHPQSVPIASYDDASQAAPRAPVYDYAESLICRTPEANDVELPNEDLRDVLANYTAQTRMVRLVFERERQALADRDAALDQQTRSLVDSRFEIADARTALEAEKAKFALQREGEEREYQGRLTDLEDREHAQTFADPRLNDPLPHFLEAIDGVKADFADMIECLEIKVTDNTDTMAEIHDAVHYNNDMTNPDGLAAQVGTVSDEIQRLADAVLALNRARAKDTRRILNAIAGHGEGSPPPVFVRFPRRTPTVKRERDEVGVLSPRKRRTSVVERDRSLSLTIIPATPSPMQTRSKQNKWSRALSNTASSSKSSKR